MNKIDTAYEYALKYVERLKYILNDFPEFLANSSY